MADEAQDAPKDAPLEDNKAEEAVELAVTNGDDTGKGEDEKDVPVDNDVPKDDGSDDEENKVQEKPEETTVVEDLQEKFDGIRDSKYSRANCLCFFTFLIVFTAMAVMARGVSDLSFTQTISMRQSLVERDEFIPWNDNGEKNFGDCSTIEDIYRFMTDIAIPFLLHPDANGDYYVQSQQALLGGIRIKQIRMNEVECSKRPKKFSPCYDPGDYYKGTVNFTHTNGSTTSFTYIDSSILEDQSWRGKYGSYPGGGYVVTLPLDPQVALDKISYLRDISFFDGATRFVALDFNTYNPSTSLHTTVRLAWEMPTGGVFPNDEVKTWKFDRYSGGDGAALAALYVMFLIWVIGMTFMEFQSCYKKGCLKKGKGSHWNSKWKGLDAINLVIFYISIILFIANETYRSNLNLYNTNEYFSFRKLQYGFTMESYSMAINGALLWIKLFKYLAINKRLRFLFTMLGRSSTDILMFVIVLGVFVIAFGTAGFLTFNSDVDDFRSYVFSMSNMVRFTIVDMDYPSLTLSARLWGSAFYFFWSLLMLLILANVFIAILTEAYSQVQMELTDDDKLDLNFLGLNGAFSKVREAVTARINAAVKHDDFDEDGDGKVSAKELAEQTNITEERAKEIIAQYDVDHDGQLDAEEFERLKQQIIEEKVQQEAVGMAALSPASVLSPDVSNQYSGVPTVSTKEFEELKKDVGEIMDLLLAVLDQTPAGKRALKQREKGEHKRKSSMVVGHKRTSSVANNQK
eukprot:CAMPEP_0197025922 /NCGR_PEP_ID=MMETSP1384-20130603/6121_1 /TAXON_ID=29189 /ORGANISM="Ammonia sp." /LENGTH=743 /DNA_ID=CAMNT_0042454511 /DNA_START=22 /DNA_END=2253 /DNA_ORIENTATION=-